MLKKGYILYVLLFAWLKPYAQLPGFSLEKYTTANGLTANKTEQLLRDSHGFLWIGTGNGLNRFDGKIFKPYNSFGVNGLTDLAVNCLAEDAEGNIWIGTGNGLNKLNPYTETITHYYEGSGAGTIPYKWCNYLYVDTQGNLWLGTEKGIAWYDKRSNSFKNFPVSLYGGDARINKFIDCMLEDSKGRFWLATSYGVKLFDRDKKTFQSFHFSETSGQSLKENVIISLFEDAKGVIWAGSWGGGLLRFKEEKQGFEKVTLQGQPGTSLVVTGISQVQLHDTAYLLLVVNGILYYLDQKGGNCKLVNATPQTMAASYRDAFVSLLNDGAGTIWLGAGNGLYKMNLTEQPVRRVNFSNTAGSGNYVWHIIPDIKQPESIFYLSTTGGWWKYETADQKMTALVLPANENKLLCYINDWLPDEHGYWFTSVEGFGYYDIYRNRLDDLSVLVKEGPGQNYTGLLAKDRNGKIWITMRRNGILIYDPVSKTSLSLFADTAKPDNIYGKSITSLVAGKDGFMYFCADNKLYRADPSDYSFRVIKFPAGEAQVDIRKIGPRKILSTADGRIIVCSELRVYELKEGQLITVYPQQGFSAFSIDNIIPGVGDDLWATTSKGIFKTDVAFTSWKNLPFEITENEESSPELAITPTGKLYCNGMGGIGIIKDELLPQTRIPPPVLINSVKYGLKQAYLVSLKPVLIRCDYKEAVEIELAAIDFVHEKENRIVYKLDSWDKEWHELTGAAVVRYDLLPPGDYVFKTKTVNTEGAESKETVLEFSVVPPFYRSWWFIVLTVLFSAMVLYVIYRYRLRRALEMERLRTRIATDLHDDIGATLSSISMYSQAIKQQLKGKDPQLENVLDRMGENSRDMVTSMSDIVWAINPENDNGAKLTGRMESYAIDICAVKHINLRFNADEKLKTVTLPLEHRKNIYLIFKEALNNAVKYSEAENIEVSLLLQNKQLILSVQDDGKGFEEQKVKPGNGLKNMRTRANEIKGDIAIGPADDKGTKVLFTCNI